MLLQELALEKEETVECILKCIKVTSNDNNKFNHFDAIIKYVDLFTNKYEKEYNKYQHLIKIKTDGK